MTLTVDNCTAFDIIEDLGQEMDLMHRPQDDKWDACFTQRAYDKVKAEGYIYEKGGQEYVKVWDNQSYPFIIHMRVAQIDHSIPEEMPYALGCSRKLVE